MTIRDNGNEQSVENVVIVGSGPAGTRLRSTPPVPT